MISNEAIEAAHKAWREQAKQDGTIFEYNLRAAIEAAAEHLDPTIKPRDFLRIQAFALREAFHEFPLETITAPDNAAVWMNRRADELEREAERA